MQLRSCIFCTSDNSSSNPAGVRVAFKELEEGESLRVTTGSIVAFEPSVKYDVQMMPGEPNKRSL